MKSKKIRILYVVSTLRQSGPTTQLLGLVTNLNKDLFDITVLTLSPEPEKTMKEEFFNANINVDSLNLSRAEFLVIGNRKLRKYINHYNPDIVHTSGIRADDAVSKMCLVDRHCMTIRNYAYEDYTAKYGKMIGRLVADYSIRVVKRCKYVICCSKTLKAMYERILPKQLYVVQNGVNTNKYKPASNLEDKISKRLLLNIPRDKAVFLAVGSLIKRKDPISIIKAFKKANFENRAILVLLGDGELMEQCRKEADKNVIIRGNVKNVVDYLQASDFFISASKSEGLPNSVLEAGSCGLNLILSDIAQHREIFEDDLDLVKFFNIGDVDTLSLTIKESIETKTNHINFELSDFIKDRFSNNVMSKNYEKIYSLIVNSYNGI